MPAEPILIIIGTSPFGSTRAAEGLDAVFATAVFDQPVAVLFMDDGVMGLRRVENGGANKNFSQMVSALPMYDVEQVYVHDESLHIRKISPSDLCLHATLLGDLAIAGLISSAKHTLSF